jgi:hypothetical protein
MEVIRGVLTITFGLLFIFIDVRFFIYALGIYLIFDGTFDIYKCDLTISLSSPVTHMLSTVRLSSLPGIPHKIRPVLVLTHICACSAFFEP